MVAFVVVVVAVVVVDYHGINFFEPIKETGGLGGSHPILKSWWEMNHPLFIEMANPSSLGLPYDIVLGCDPLSLMKGIEPSITTIRDLSSA